MSQLDYSRQQGAVDPDVLRKSHLVAVGVGSFSHNIKNFVRMGVGKLTIIDPDRIEFRNVTSQGYTYRDAQQNRLKVEALVEECLAINPEAQITGLAEDFTKIPDAQLKALLADASVLIMATDHHPAQARGALAGLVCDVPVILASLYRRGHAGEIVFQYPGQTAACYRDITRDRYAHVAQNRTNGTGTANGSLPFAPQLVDSIVGFLTIGILHKRHGSCTNWSHYGAINDNEYGHWIDCLQDRNFIQTRMAPGYELGGEDIFGDVFGHGEKVFCCDTIWQSGKPEVQADCPDCHGQGARPVGKRRHESTEMEQLACGCLIQKTDEPRTTCPACKAPLADVVSDSLHRELVGGVA